MERPTEQAARQIVERELGAAVASVRRFPIGGSRYVYECVSDGRAVVVRIGTADRPLAAAIAWHRRLADVGVPIPELLGDGDEPFPYMLLSRLPGTDLGDVVRRLSRSQLRAIAARVAGAQRRVALLPPLTGFGYARAYDDPDLVPHWSAVLDRLIERSRARVDETHAFDTALLDLVTDAIDDRRAELDAVAATPFLDDTTTRNVIVDSGKFSGIVDYDTVASGDPLFVPALTRVALIAHDHDDAYADLLLDAMGGARALLPLYEALFCVDILSEQGVRFNRDEPEPYDSARRQRLERLARERLRA